MANVTITVDDGMLARVRREAEAAGKSLSRWIADLIEAEEARLTAERVAAMEKFLELAKYVPATGKPWKFNRDEIYERPYPGGHQRGDLQPRWPSAEEASKVRGVGESPDHYRRDGGEPASVQRGRQRRPKKDTGAG